MTIDATYMCKPTQQAVPTHCTSAWWARFSSAVHPPFLIILIVPSVDVKFNKSGGTILNWLCIDATVWLSAFMTAPREMMCYVRQREYTKLVMRGSVLMWQNVICDIPVRTAWTIRLGLSYAHLKANTLSEQIYNTCVSVRSHVHSFRVVGLLNYQLEK